MRRSLGACASVFLVLALERLLNATMTGSDFGARTAWLLSQAFALTGAVLLGLFLLTRGGAKTSPDGVDPDTGSSHRRPK